MKVYKDVHMKIFPPYIISKNILEKEFTTGISYFPVSVKKFLCISVLRVASGSRVKLASCKSALKPPFFFRIFYDMPKITQSRIKDINNMFL